MSRYCSQCAQLLNDTAKFCRYCGAPCEADLPPAEPVQPGFVRPAAPSPVQAPYPVNRFDMADGEPGANPYAPSAAARAPRRSVKGLVAALAVVSALIAACVVLLILLYPFG